MASLLLNLPQSIQAVFELHGNITFISPLLIAIILGAAAYLTWVPANKGTIPSLGGIPIIAAWNFFVKRHDFIWNNFKGTPEPMFKFKVLHHTVVVARGEEARKVVFDTKGLNATEGYKILLGGAPRLSEIAIENDSETDGTWLSKQIARLLNRNRINDMLPQLMVDIDRQAQGWGTQGIMDPFYAINNVVYQLTIRMGTCSELADNWNSIQEVQQLYEDLVKNSTPQALLLPWFPSRSKKNKMAAVQALYIKTASIVESRRRANLPSSDAIDVLISEGHTTEAIVQFIMNLMFAGVVNTSLMTSWCLVYVGMHSEWKDKVKAEVDALLEKHAASPSDPLHQRLGSIPNSAWEDETPAFEAIIRETVRLTMIGTILRRNILDDMTVAGYTIHKGNFIGYSMADCHLNPEIYSSPEIFDPARYGPGREEDKKETFGYVGWGAGRHPCTGMKVAKLEIKVIIAYMLAGYEFNVVDSNGNPLDHLPLPDRNDSHQARPAGDPFFVEFKRVVT